MDQVKDKFKTYFVDHYQDKVRDIDEIFKFICDNTDELTYTFTDDQLITYTIMKKILYGKVDSSCLGHPVYHEFMDAVQR